MHFDWILDGKDACSIHLGDSSETLLLNVHRILKKDESLKFIVFNSIFNSIFLKVTLYNCPKMLL